MEPHALSGDFVKIMVLILVLPKRVLFWQSVYWTIVNAYASSFSPFPISLSNFLTLENHLPFGKGKKALNNVELWVVLGGKFHSKKPKKPKKQKKKTKKREKRRDDHH